MINKRMDAVYANINDIEIKQSLTQEETKE